MAKKTQSEKHYTQRIGWLRATVLGANDGIISTASLIMGVASAGSSSTTVLTAGVAGLVAGALSMAAGEYVSVSSQADTERADLVRESKELEDNPKYEHKELARIYVNRGLDKKLAKEVARQLMEKDALEAHARDEIGISSTVAAKPIQAALSSAAAFTLGAILPILMVLVSPNNYLIYTVPLASLVALGLTGAISARVGGSKKRIAVVRLIFWGALAMGLTAVIGRLVGAAV